MSKILPEIRKQLVLGSLVIHIFGSFHRALMLKAGSILVGAKLQREEKNVHVKWPWVTEG